MHPKRAAGPLVRPLVVMAMTAGLLIGCSSSRAPARTTPLLSAVTPGSARGLTAHVPFTADDGALVVAAGAAPVGFPASAAENEFSTIMTSTLGDPDARVPHELLAGRVTLAPGLGVPPMLGVRAWVVVYGPPAPSCAPGRPGTSQPALPPDASGLSALIFTEPGAVHAITYQGAGTGGCGVLSAEPMARVGAPGY